MSRYKKGGVERVGEGRAEGAYASMCLIVAESCFSHQGPSQLGVPEASWESGERERKKAHRNARQREPHRKLLHVLRQLPQRLPRLSLSLRDRLDEVLQQLTPRLLLRLQRNLLVEQKKFVSAPSPQ